MLIKIQSDEIEVLSELIHRYWMFGYCDLQWQSALKDQLPRLIKENNIDEG